MPRPVRSLVHKHLSHYEKYPPLVLWFHPLWHYLHPMHWSLGVEKAVDGHQSRVTTKYRVGGIPCRFRTSNGVPWRLKISNVLTSMPSRPRVRPDIMPGRGSTQKGNQRGSRSDAAASHKRWLSRPGFSSIRTSSEHKEKTEEEVTEEGWRARLIGLGDLNVNNSIAHDFYLDTNCALGTIHMFLGPIGAFKATGRNRNDMGVRKEGRVDSTKRMRSFSRRADACQAYHC